MQVMPSTPTTVTPAPVSGVNYDPAGAAGATTAAHPIRLPSSAKFDPAIHLCYQPPSKKYTFDDLKLEVADPVGPIAITEPFPLFTWEGIKELRKDCLSTQALDDFMFTSKLAACQVRGYHPTVAPFVHQAFSSPEFLRACSEAAGVELVPIMPVELGHTNFQVGKEGKDTIRSLSIEPSEPGPPIQTVPEDDGGSVVNWHYDAYPYVAVTMLSDVTNMIGGETAIKQGDGVIAKIRGPAIGYTTVMQGRYVRHLACKAYNAKERITMVTSLRAKDPSLPDASTLITIRPISKPNQINAQWSIYRLRLVAERMDRLAKSIEDASKDDVFSEKDVCNKQTMQTFLDAQVKYLQYGINEMM